MLTCGHCLYSYADPRVLPCLHVFCRCCIYGPTNDRRSTVFCCPACHTVTDLTALGENGLLPAHHVHHLFDIRDVLTKVDSLQERQCEKCEQERASSLCRDCGQYICVECIQTHELWSELRSHDIVPISRVIEEAVEMLPPKRRTLRCSKHSKELELYCRSCAELICHNCTVQQHKKHNYHIVSDVFPNLKEAVGVNAKLLRGTLTLVNEALEEFDACAGRITSQRDSLQQDIDETIRRLHEELESRRKEFTEQLQQIADEKMRLLALQRRKVETLQKQLDDALAFTDRHMKTSSEGEVLAVSRHIVRRSVELVNSYQPDILIPNQAANMIFKPERLQEVCSPYRGVCIAFVCPAKCLVSSTQPMEVAFTNIQSTAIVHLKDENGADYFNPLKHITATLVSSSDTLQCQVDHHTNGSHIVSYTPKLPKRYRLSIQINGIHVQGSPFMVLVKRSSSDIVMSPRVLKGLKRPCGVACNSKGEVLVVESGLYKVSVYTLGGSNVVRRFGSFGSAPGQFNDPDGITVDGSDNILVVDSGNHRIQKFTAEGEFITTVGTKGDGPLQFNLPTNIRIHPQTGNVYVCDQYNHRVQIMKEDFSFVGSFGREGSEDGDLYGPSDVAFDGAGNTYVCDSWNNRIQVFDPSGHFLRKFGDKRVEGDGAQDPLLSSVHMSVNRGEVNMDPVPFSSEGTSGVSLPSGLYIDCDGYVFVTEATNCVSIFKTDGTFVTSFGVSGNALGEFNTPHGIVRNSEGVVCVSDNGNNRVQLF